MAAVACRGAVDHGNPVVGQGGGFGFAGIVFQHLGAGFRRGVCQLQRFQIPGPCQLVLGGEANRRVLRGFAGHRDGPLGHGGDSGGAGVGGGHAGLALADQDAQPDLGAFRPLRLLQLPATDVDGEGGAGGGDGVGLVGPGLAGGGEQGGGEGGEMVGHGDLWVTGSQVIPESGRRKWRLGEGAGKVGAASHDGTY